MFFIKNYFGNNNNNFNKRKNKKNIMDLGAPDCFNDLTLIKMLKKIFKIFP